MNNYLDIILSLPKSAYFCFKQMPLRQALRLPVLVSWRTKFKTLSGKIEFSSADLKFGMVRFGLSGSGTAIFMPVVIENEGCMEFGKGVRFGGGCQISIGKEARLRVGDNTNFTGECHILASRSITLGEHCLISWNTHIMDTDIHKIYTDNKLTNADSPVCIGNDIWICNHVIIGKGVKIPDNVVIAAGSLITKPIMENNIVCTGMPLKVLKRNIRWEE